MKKSLLLLLAILTLSLTSCKDDDPEPTKTELLTGKEWTRMKSESLKNDQLTATENDGNTTVKFNPDFTGKTVGQEVYTWSWAFASSETKLVISGSDGGEVYDLETLSKSNLIFSYTEDYEDSNGVLATYKDIFYLEHK